LLMFARVEGKLPADLEGTYYRNGPGRVDVG
jgi:carotenoid cleavage dioxygenase-like enzyme